MTAFDREAWLQRVIDMQMDARNQGRTRDAGHLGFLAVKLESRADDHGRLEASGRQLRGAHLTSTAFRATLNVLEQAGLIESRGLGRFQLSTEATARVHAQ